MYAIFKTELINGSVYKQSRPRPWVARLTALDKQWGFVREFIQPWHDYTYARRSGSRGIMAYFALPPGLYEIYHCTSWRSDERFFAISDGAGELTRVTREDITCRLKDTTSA